MTFSITAIICAHNPRAEHLKLVLNALRAQTLPSEEWELLIVDNQSCPSIEPALASEWHPNVRVIREPRLGLTFARLRGIAEAQAPVLVFVDDDCVLAPDYLESALQIAGQHPTLGVWGGRVELDCEVPPPEWANRYRTFLVERLVDRDEIISGAELKEPLPVGAGLCVRSEAARHHARQVMDNSLQQLMDRKGQELCSGGDTDLVLTVCEGGWDRGVFKGLLIRHLIPKERLEEEYLASLVGGIALSAMLLEWIHAPHVPPPPVNAWWWIKYGCDCATKFGRRRRFFKSVKRAHRTARTLYEEYAAQGSGKPNAES